MFEEFNKFVKVSTRLRASAYKSSFFLLLLVLPLRIVLPTCPDSHCPTTLTMHILTPTHTHWLTYMHTCIRPFHLCPNCTDPNLPVILGARSHTPLPSPSLSLSLPCTSLPLPHSFLLTNKPPLAYPCIPPLPHTGTFTSAHTFWNLNTLTFRCMHTRLLTHLCVLYHSARPWITKLVHTHPNNPSACLNTSISPAPPSEENTPHSSPNTHCHWQTPPPQE